MSRAFLLVVVVLVMFAAAGCSPAKTKVITLPAPTDLRGRTQVEIDAKNFQFTPNDVIVDVGTKVTWRNTDTVTHNVKKAADVLDFGAPFGVNVFNPGASYSFTFTKVGTFPYTCTIHAGMVGTVQVVAK